MNEFLIGRYSVDRDIEHDDCARTFSGGRTQREIGAARQLPPGLGMTRRLSKTCMRVYSDDTIEPVRARNRFKRGTDDCLSIDMRTGRHYDCKLIGGDPPARRVSGQSFLQ